MRSLLLIVLSTLAVLLAATEAVSPNAPNLEAVTKNRKYTLTSKIQPSSAEYSVNEKRNLRADIGNMGMEAFKTDDEERLPSISTLVEKIKAFLYGFKLGFSPKTESKLVLRYEEKLLFFFTKIYNAKETPESLRAKYMGRRGNVVIERFDAWYKKKVAANELAPN
ncbi:hypothetical protein F441_15136 [Phytophthora nicotianae CJ01A1]|uniref:RxLR effector protein n=2 Tax=Phytophthora nicotianae TaxID=4792 RepID=W2WEB9_PHYNI|nr:hypothetical protein L915_14869 [Phytophthora nicotianae]ETP08960.1 hypothetical protein F441_15136 [Phytophthora nicotianae CJ01A1]